MLDLIFKAFMMAGTVAGVSLSLLTYRFFTKGNK